MSYTLDPGQKNYNYEDKRFTRKELQAMSTYKLKKICRHYRIVNAYQDSYAKEELINIILKHRGVKDPNLIWEQQEDGLNRIQQVVDEHLTVRLNPEDKLRVPAKMVVYDQVGVSKRDRYKVVAENEVETSNVLLVNGKNDYLCGVFNLQPDPDREDVYYLVANSEQLRLDQFENKDYSLLFFRKEDSDYLYECYYSQEQILPQNLEYYRLPIVDFNVQKLETTKTVLCIDFGTSNTTAGAYLDSNYVSNLSENELLQQQIKVNEINFVKFPYQTARQKQWVEAIPTVVYVKDCSDPEDIKFLFGHEAKYRMSQNDYTSSASYFQGIKRWVNTYQKEEEIYDEAGNVVTVSRGKIISEYINYVLDIAERQFKCKFKNIHISSPVKFKTQFLHLLQEILPDYKVETKDVLDEGVSVLYNTIANQIEQGKFRNGEEYEALIIDCGGGTTDLSSCKFSIKEGDISYQVDLKTGFENGDTNFGGNNITYRILQFMKIVLAQYYTDGSIVEIDELIPTPNVDLFRQVEEAGIESIYQEVEEEYEQAEQVIPTRYKEYENKTSLEYQKVKNNFYFLWELAETMKKQFFKKTSILRNKFASTDFEAADNDLHITPLDKWSLSIYQEGRLQEVQQFPEVIFNIREITKLIRADVYEIVRKFLEDLYRQGQLMNYSIIKLTGQSCKIDLFREALKEFVPGKSIEFKRRQEQKEGSLELKLSCLRGVIRYMKAKKAGAIEVNIASEPPVIPYLITAFNFRGQEQVIIESQQQLTEVQGQISKPFSAREVKFYLKSEEGAVKKEYLYENDAEQYEDTEADALEEEYPGNISQQKTDTIRNGEVKFFLFTEEDRWGFFVLPVGRQDDQLQVGEKRFFRFEDELSQLNFFDGLK